ncbi:DUF1835 domain-containing protein [Desulforamulus ruminis]|uniref:DUF1835 domain-containing protein n=1 Tax=Desulforamulus ruminis TaxID=1564 RepID=UPI002FDB154A
MIKDLRKIVKELKESEARSLLLIILLRIKCLAESGYSQEQFSDDLIALYKELLHFSEIKNKIDETYKTIHMVFGDSIAGTLRVALRDLGLKHEEQVIGFSENFSIGPIWKLQDEAGRKYRYEWIRDNINDYLEEDCGEDYEENFKNTFHKISAIPEQVPIIIWNGENAHEQTGVRYALYLLHKRKNNVFLINTTEAYKTYFNHPGIEDSPLHTGKIEPERLKVIYAKSRLPQPLSCKNRNRFVQEWESITNNQEVLRIWQNGKLQSVADNFYDQNIINMAQKLHSKQKNKDFMRSAVLIGEVLAHLNQYVGDQFLEYRLRHLIYNGVFDIKGIPKAMRYYSVKLKQFYLGL